LLGLDSAAEPRRCFEQRDLPWIDEFDEAMRGGEARNTAADNHDTFRRHDSHQEGSSRRAESCAGHA
jgi:hypothetical protein